MLGLLVDQDLHITSASRYFFFGFTRYYSVTQMLLEVHIASFETVLVKSLLL